MLGREKKQVILRIKGNKDEDSLELFVGSHNNGESFIINVDKQLDWLQLIADNVRTSRKRNA